MTEIEKCIHLIKLATERKQPFSSNLNKQLSVKLDKPYGPFPFRMTFTLNLDGDVGYETINALSADGLFSQQTLENNYASVYDSDGFGGKCYLHHRTPGFSKARHCKIEYQLIKQGFYQDDSNIFTFDKENKIITRTTLGKNSQKSVLNYPYDNIENFLLPNNEKKNNTLEMKKIMQELKTKGFYHNSYYVITMDAEQIVVVSKPCDYEKTLKLPCSEQDIYAFLPKNLL